MDGKEIEKEDTAVEVKNKKSNLFTIVRYIFGTIFLFFSLVSIISHSYIAGLLFLLAAIMAIPQSASIVEKKLNISIPGIAEFFIIFLLVAVAFAVIPPSTNTVDTSAVAEAPSSANSSGYTSVPSESKTSISDGSAYVIGTNFNCTNWSNEQYPVVKLFGEKYVALLPYNEKIWNTHVNKLAKLVLDSGDRYTLKTGEKVDLGHGYALEAKQVDVDGQKVWLEFTKDGKFVDDQIVSTDTGDHTWTCTVDKIQGEDNIPVLKVRVNQVFQGAVDSIAQIDGLWLIDYANAKTLEVGDKLGYFKLVKINNGVDNSNLGSLLFESDGSQNNIQTAQTATSTPDTSEYQDKEWLNSCANQAPIISDDLDKVSNAASNLNVGDLEKYGVALATDSKTSLDESQSYIVSPSLQPAKEKYEAGLYDLNQAGYYCTTGVANIKSGYSEQAKQDLETATDYLNLGSENLKEAKSLLDSYNLK